MPTLSWPPLTDLPPADQDQKRAADTFRSIGSLIVEASPGTGKTFLGVYLALCAARLGWTSQSRRTLFLTFSRNARVRIENEVQRYNQEGWADRKELGSMMVLNYHAFFLDILRKMAGFWGCSQDLRPASLTERKQQVEAILSKNTSLYDDVSAVSNQALLIFALRRYGIADLMNPDSELTLGSSDLEQLYENATRELRVGRPHYDDFAPLVLNLLEHCPELVEWLRTAYPVVILDEFQDTDLVQWEIIRRVRSRRIVILLDRFQMIYGWRGSRANRIDQARRDFGIPEDAERTLTKIHRIGDEADLARFIQGLRQDELRGGALEAETNRSWLRIYPVKKWANTSSRHWGRISDEAKCLTAIRTGGFVNVKESTAILTRTNHLADYLYRHLRTRPETGQYFACRWIGGENSTDEAFRDFVWNLRGVRDEISLRGWLGSLLDAAVPRQVLSAMNIEFAKEFASECEDLLKRRRRPDLRAVRNSIVSWWDTVQLGEYAAIARALRTIPILGRALLKGEGFLDSDSVYYIRELARATEDFASRPDRQKWTEFCDHLENRLIQAAYLRLREKPRGLFIMTVHQSKGREFDHVIIPWLSSRGEPGRTGHGKPFMLKYRYGRFEDRRLLYVAFTRARSRVTVIFPQDDPSEFLSRWRLYDDSRPDAPEQLTFL